MEVVDCHAIAAEVAVVGLVANEAQSCRLADSGSQEDPASGQTAIGSVHLRSVFRKVLVVLENIEVLDSTVHPVVSRCGPAERSWVHS